MSRYWPGILFTLITRTCWWYVSHWRHDLYLCGLEAHWKLYANVICSGNHFPACVETRARLVWGLVVVERAEVKNFPSYGHVQVNVSSVRKLYDRNSCRLPLKCSINWPLIEPTSKTSLCIESITSNNRRSLTCEYINRRKTIITLYTWWPASTCSRLEYATVVSYLIATTKLSTSFRRQATCKDGELGDCFSFRTLNKQCMWLKSNPVMQLTTPVCIPMILPCRCYSERFWVAWH